MKSSLPYFVLTVLTYCSPAFAQESDESIVPAREVLHHRSVTMSPIHLVYPEMYAGYEHKLDRKMSVGFIVGAGSYEGFPVYELGGNWNRYLIGSFEHGMPINLELGYLHMRATDDTDPAVTASANAVYTSAMVGYKYIADYGLTVSLGAGAQYFLGSVTGMNARNGSRVTIDLDGLGPAVRAMVGWSFN